MGLVTRKLVAPSYLFACLLLGGSVQNIWFNAVLQFFAAALIAWAIFDTSRQPISSEARQLLLLSVLMVILVTTHLIPIPFSLWKSLPGRQIIASGATLLGLQPSWAPLSLSPYATVTAGLTMLPPLGLLAAMICLRAYTRVGIALALFAGTFLGLGLGLLQVSMGGGFYLQPEHRTGTASGFFANPNHMATLLLVCVPYLGALIASKLQTRTPHSRQDFGVFIAVAAAIILVVVSLIFNGSQAGLILSFPVLLLSAMLVVKFPTWLKYLAHSGLFLSIFLFAFVLAVPFDRLPVTGHAAEAISTRQSFLSTGFKTARSYFPFGSGVGTFQSVYKMEEDFVSLDPTEYVNHVHDDYLEVLIEAGLPGAMLIAAFFAWFLKTCAQLAASRRADSFYSCAGAVASWTILIHSMVDYPLRTSAIAAILATSLAMAVSQPNHKSFRDQNRGLRHVELS